MIASAAMAAGADFTAFRRFWGAVDTWIRHRLRNSSTASWFAVARKILDTWFGGDPAAFLADASRCPGWTAFQSRCALCCPLRKLRVAVYVLTDLHAYGEDVALWLSMTQHERLQPIADRTRRAELARAAHAGRWSTRQLTDAIAINRASQALACRGRGRPHV